MLLNLPTEMKMLFSYNTVRFEYDNKGTLLSRSLYCLRSKPERMQRFYGPYEFCGDTITAIHFDNGYYDSQGKVYYHIADYQGNVTSVMRGDGTTVQTAAYYPYGEPWLEPEGSNRRLFTGKERLTDLGISLSDYGARLMNHRTIGRTTQDPCAEDFHWLSPYTVCAGDPINHIDNQGRNIVVLYRFPLHVGMLIGNSETEYRYYSVNGVKFYKKTDGYLGGPRDNLGEHTPFPTVRDFLDSEYNTTGTKEEIKDDKTSGYHYTHSFEIETTPEEDAAAIEAFKKVAEQGYLLWGNNCADAVREALLAVGINIPKKTFLEIMSAFLIKTIVNVRFPFIPKLHSNAMFIQYLQTTVPDFLYFRLKDIRPDGVERLPSH